MKIKKIQEIHEIQKGKRSHLFQFVFRKKARWWSSRQRLHPPFPCANCKHKNPDGENNNCVENFTLWVKQYFRVQVEKLDTLLKKLHSSCDVCDKYQVCPSLQTANTRILMGKTIFCSLVNLFQSQKRKSRKTERGMVCSGSVRSDFYA